jgi:hypothetical protein
VPEAECPERARADALGGEPPEEDERVVPLPERPAPSRSRAGAR